MIVMTNAVLNLMIRDTSLFLTAGTASFGAQAQYPRTDCRWRDDQKAVSHSVTA